MIKIKEPSVAGTFYPDNKEDLEKLIKIFKEQSKNTYEVKGRAVIVPHAGLVFSGRLSYEGISQLDSGIKNLFIIAPCHKTVFKGLALSNYNRWKTPLGNISVNKALYKELEKKYGAFYNDEAFEEEHSIEVLVPLIQTLFEEVNIIPILYGQENPEKIESIISEYYSDKENGFIISSDLSHFMSDKDARGLDGKTAAMIESGNLFGMKYEQACGSVGIAGLVGFANKNKFSLIRIDMTNSSAVNSDKSRVVGYGCWFLYEGDKNKFIKKYYSKFVTDLSRTILKSQFDKKPVTIHYPQVFDEAGACFITLEKGGKLRGCIGSIIAHRSLVADIVENTRNAAFNDYRFNPVEESEVKDLKISVSILTPPVKIEFEDEQDLLNKIVPKKDGIIIKDGKYQAVYLPSVWEELPDKKEFLNSLKIKAGLHEDYFSYSIQAFRFETIYIKE